jgi:hypothetical protein
VNEIICETCQSVPSELEGVALTSTISKVVHQVSSVGGEVFHYFEYGPPPEIDGQH